MPETPALEAPAPFGEQESGESYIDRLEHWIRGSQSVIAGLKAELRDVESERDRARAEAEAYRRGWYTDLDDDSDNLAWYGHNKGAGQVLQCLDSALVSHLASLEKP